jgi:hypothetical protein
MVSVSNEKKENFITGIKEIKDIRPPHMQITHYLL